MEPPAKTDHDLLIRVDTKVDSLVIAFRELKEGSTATLAEHGVRIRKLEDASQKYDAETLIPRFLKVEKDVNDFQANFKATIKVSRYVFLVMGGLISFILTQLPTILKGWGLI